MPNNYVGIYLNPMPNCPSTQIITYTVGKLGFGKVITTLIICFLAFA